MYELCCKYDIAILEDNPYGELRFAGENVANYQINGYRGQGLYMQEASQR